MSRGRLERFDVEVSGAIWLTLGLQLVNWFHVSRIVYIDSLGQEVLYRNAL
jgi:hypothetical protein